MHSRGFLRISLIRQPEVHGSCIFRMLNFLNFWLLVLNQLSCLGGFLLYVNAGRREHIGYMWLFEIPQGFMYTVAVGIGYSLISIRFNPCMVHSDLMPSKNL
jgi:hypothetical protein